MFTGVDIVQISRIDDLISRHGPVLKRFFTEQELAYCQDRGKGQAASMAGIFAAKEALFKALGTGFRQGKWTDVEVVHDEWGAPHFRFYGFYAEAVPKRSPHTAALSISHDGDYAIAYVILP
jgi:holo-[acyl-carrier protein] synthase